VTGEPSVPGGVIAVVRAGSTEECRTIVAGLGAAGVGAIEVTMTVPGAVGVIAELAPEDGPPIGAGTVLDAGTAVACAAAGARFLVSPVTDPASVAAAHEAGVVYVGGALTPTEVFAAVAAGVDAVKIFPIGVVGGARYLAALREPFPDLAAVVSGGIAAADVGTYFAAGAHAVCLGGALIDRAAAASGDIAAVADYARAALARAREEK
jgi:2-dehydro-3-deoxyphosphogluconate aldolase/(4S)-4-hydroxy-2-oxoglutarate aldolase